MKVEMLVRVDVIEREPCRAIRLKLSLDFCRHLPAHRGARKYIDAKTCHVVAKSSGLIDEIRQASRRQDGLAVDQHEMQADMQSWQPAGARDRILRCRTGNNETGSG